MKNLIIYPNDNGSVSFVYPNLNCGLTIEEIALKDVPNGIPYLLVDEVDVPTDHTYFEAFTADFSNPDGHGIGAEAWFAANAKTSTLDMSQTGTQTTDVQTVEASA